MPVETQQHVSTVKLSPLAIFWFAFGCALAFLFYLFLIILPVGVMINEPFHVPYSFYTLALGGIMGLFATFLVIKKEKIGFFWAFVSLPLLFLGLFDIGLGKPERNLEGVQVVGVIAFVILLTQLFYAKKSIQNQEYKFQTALLAQNTPFAEDAEEDTKEDTKEDIVALCRAWKAYSAFPLTVTAPALFLALVCGRLLGLLWGGFIGNALAVCLVFVALIALYTQSRKRKKLYVLCRDKLNQTDEEVKQAFRKKV